MNTILQKLGIKQDNNLTVIKEDLERLQLEHLHKLDFIQHKAERTENEDHLKEQLESELVDIETALTTVLEKIKSISTGVSISKVEPLGQKEIEENKEKAEDFQTAESPYDTAMDPDHLCDEAEKYYRGNNVLKNYEKSFELYSKAEQLGSARAAAGLAYLYMNACNVPKNTSMALELSKKAAALNEPLGLCNLGMMYFKGDGLQKDEGKALELITKAAEQGDSRSQFLRGCISIKRGLYQDAEEWFRKSMEQGYHKAAFALAMIYKDGLTGKKKLLDAYRILKNFQYDKQSEQLLIEHSKNNSIDDYIFIKRLAEFENDQVAYRYLGDMNYYGLGTVKDYKEAFTCYKKAAIGNEKDSNAAGLLEKVDAAVGQEMEFQQAMRMLETSSFNMGIDTLKKLAKEGFADAMFEVGKLYQNGYRIPKNEKLSYKCFIAASLNGHQEAAQYLANQNLSYLVSDVEDKFMFKLHDYISLFGMALFSYRTDKGENCLFKFVENEEGSIDLMGILYIKSIGQAPVVLDKKHLLHRDRLDFWEHNLSIVPLKKYDKYDMLINPFLYSIATGEDIMDNKLSNYVSLEDKKKYVKKLGMHFDLLFKGSLQFNTYKYVFDLYKDEEVFNMDKKSKDSFISYYSEYMGILNFEEIDLGISKLQNQELHMVKNYSKLFLDMYKGIADADSPDGLFRVLGKDLYSDMLFEESFMTYI